jgi:hypothetical protein
LISDRVSSNNDQARAYVAMSKSVEFETTLTPSEVQARLRLRTGGRLRVWPGQDKPLTGRVASDSADFRTAVFWMPSRGRILTLKWQPTLDGGTLLRGSFHVNWFAKFLLFLVFLVGALALVESSFQNFRAGGSLVAPVVIFVGLAMAGFWIFRFDQRVRSFGEDRLILQLRDVLKGDQRTPHPPVVGGEVIRPRRR